MLFSLNFLPFQCSLYSSQYFPLSMSSIFNRFQFPQLSTSYPHSQTSISPSFNFFSQYSPFSMFYPLKTLFSILNILFSQTSLFFLSGKAPAPPLISFPLNITLSQYHFLLMSFSLNIILSQLFALSMFSFLKPKYPPFPISPVSISSLVLIFSSQYLPIPNMKQKWLAP